MTDPMKNTDHQDTITSTTLDIPIIGNVISGSTELVVSENIVTDLKMQDSFEELVKCSKSYRTKVKQLANARNSVLGAIARFIEAAEGNVAIIRAFVEGHGYTWPQANAVNPAESAMVKMFIYPDDDIAIVGNRVSEAAKIVKVLVTQGHTSPDSAKTFISGNGGIKGIYGKFGNDGHPKPEPEASVEGSEAALTPSSKAEQSAVAESTGTSQSVVSVKANIIDLTAELAEAEARRKEVVKSATVANEKYQKAVSEVEQAAKKEAEQAETKVYDLAKEKENRLKEEAAQAAEEAKQAESRVEVLETLKTTSCLGKGTFYDGTIPSSPFFEKGEHAGFSFLLVHNNGDGSFDVIGNLTPNHESFMGITNRTFLKS